MFFVIAKTLGVMAQAPQIFFELLLSASSCCGRAGTARADPTTLMAAIIVVSVTPLAMFRASARRPLSAARSQRIAPTGIIVLGGAMDEGVTRARKTPALNDAAERLTEPVALLRRFPNARLVFSGGSGRLTRPTLDWRPMSRA